MMKKILLLLTLSLSLFANEKMMKSVYENILLENTKQAIFDATKLKKDLKSLDINLLRADFKALAVSWKKVETFYLAAEFNEDAIDIPRYIDVFHNLKENLHAQLARVVDSKESLDVEMYKNSFKTINALEYVLYDKAFTSRHKDMAQMIIKNIIERLQEIEKVYQFESKRFLTEFKWANDVIINMLIDSSFKLKDWRIGDVAGLSRKYKGDADNRRGEYYLSQNSFAAIESILQLHAQVMDSKEYDFGDMLKENGYAKEVSIINNEIKNSLENLYNLPKENFEDKRVNKLYESVSQLHVAYYASLVNALGVTSKILDADGD